MKRAADIVPVDIACEADDVKSVDDGKAKVDDIGHPLEALEGVNCLAT